MQPLTLIKHYNAISIKAHSEKMKIPCLYKMLVEKCDLLLYSSYHKFYSVTSKIIFKCNMILRTL